MESKQFQIVIRNLERRQAANERAVQLEFAVLERGYRKQGFEITPVSDTEFIAVKGTERYHVALEAVQAVQS
jgi:hypothetical protein